MFSRYGRLVNGFGALLMAASFIWVLGVAGADDLDTMQQIASPILPLIVKAGFGVIGMGLGLLLASIREVEA